MSIVKNMSTGRTLLTEKRASFITADMAAYWVQFASIIVLPLVSFWMIGLAPDVSKKFFLLSLLVVTIALWLVGRLQEGEIKIPWTLPMLALALVPLSFVISGIFSVNPYYSLVGPLYQSGTAFSIIALAISFFLVATLFDSRKKIFNLYLVISLSSIVLAVYQIVIFAVGGLITTSIFNFLPQSLIGKWFEMSVFFGFTSIVSLLMLELSATGDSVILKRLSITSLVLSLLMMSFTNFIAGWVVVGLVALLTFVYGITVSSRELRGNGVSPQGFLGGQKVFRASFFVVLVALLFLILGRQGGLLAEKLNSAYSTLNISFLEARPSWSSTGAVAKEVLMKDPLTGIGPSNFSNAWAVHKPRLINELQYWNVNFADAVGILPTFAVTTGILGILAWLFLAGSLLYVAVKAFRIWSTDPLSQFLITLSFVGMVYFWVMSIIYTPDSIGLPMLFVMSGIFIATLSASKIVPIREIKLHSNPRNYFAALLVLVLLLIVTIAGGYLLIQRFWSVVTYQKAVNELSLGNFTNANNLLVKSINLNSGDPLYYRALAENKIREMNGLLSSSEVDKETAQPLLQNIVTVAIGAAGEAVRLNPADYTNHMTHGGVYEYLSNLKIPRAYDQALGIYQATLKEYPNNPEILLALARLEISQSKFNSARNYLEQALAIKTNYTSSILLLTQLDLEGSGTMAAIERLEKAVATMPNDPSLFFQLGFLRYRAGDYEGSIQAMKKVQTLSPNGLNANASYFLGLAYDAQGLTAKALEQFELIAKFNPDNAEVAQIVRNLRAGRDALSGIGPAKTTEAETPEEDAAAKTGEEETDQTEN